MSEATERESPWDAVYRRLDEVGERLATLFRAGTLDSDEYEFLVRKLGVVRSQTYAMERRLSAPDTP